MKCRSALFRNRVTHLKAGTPEPAQGQMKVPPEPCMHSCEARLDLNSTCCTSYAPVPGITVTQAASRAGKTHRCPSRFHSGAQAPTRAGFGELGEDLHMCDAAGAGAHPLSSHASFPFKRFKASEKLPQVCVRRGHRNPLSSQAKSHCQTCADAWLLRLLLARCSNECLASGLAGACSMVQWKSG